MPNESLNIGTQLQLFLDDWLIETMKNLTLKLHSPQPREIVIRADRPYETSTLYDPVVIKDGELYRMWYRTNFDAPPYYTGYAESNDGICWTKPSLNLIEHNGSTDNNLLWQAGEDDGYVLSIFKDGNPNAPDTERYKAIAVSKRGIVGLVSPDGIHWSNLQQEPIIVGPKGDAAFDSHNIAFWDSVYGHYVAYLRGWRGGIRGIRRGISTQTFLLKEKSKRSEVARSCEVRSKAITRLPKQSQAPLRGTKQTKQSIKRNKEEFIPLIFATGLNWNIST